MGTIHGLILKACARGPWINDSPGRTADEEESAT
jgi:hypothetical protein